MEVQPVDECIEICKVRFGETQEGVQSSYVNQASSRFVSSKFFRSLGLDIGNSQSPTSQFGKYEPITIPATSETACHVV